jgi:hypothetical protein
MKQFVCSLCACNQPGNSSSTVALDARQQICWMQDSKYALYADLAAPDCVTRVFSHADQSGLSRTLFKMKGRRAQLLHLPYPY